MNAQLLKLTFMLLMLFPVFAGAQQVNVLSESVEFSGRIGSSQRKTVILHNESAQPKTFLLRNIKGSIGSSQKMRICLGDQCFDPKKDLAKVMLTLAPGEIYTDLFLEFELGIAETLGSFDLVFVNSEALRDFFVVEAKYSVSSESKTDFSNWGIFIPILVTA